MYAAKPSEPVVIEEDGQVLATIVCGDDGSWWATLSGRVPTTLGPSRHLGSLVRLARRTWQELNA